MANPDVGTRAPEFELAGTGDRSYRLADYRGRWVVLAFYPGDFTPSCTRQFCSYRDEQDEVAAFDAELLGISPQGVESHERFVREHDLTVSLLADENKDVARAYGVLGPGGYVRRSIIIIDPEGIVRHRHVALIGLTYQKAGDIARALVDAREQADR
jgi:peroxiredoxin Q/BCP